MVLGLLSTKIAATRHYSPSLSFRPPLFFRIDSPPETLAVTSDHSVKWEGKAAG